MSFVLCALIGVLIGGIPFGIVVSRAVRGIDPRQIGSGTSGATNVSRALGKGWGIVVLVLDACKGYLPVKYLAPLLMQDDPTQGGLILAVAATAGHVWTPYARFRGGKGVATAAGAMLALNPASLLLALGIWAIVVAIFRFVSLGSLLAAICFPVIAWRINPDEMGVVKAGALIAVLLIFTHRANLLRILRGTENRLF